MSNNKHIVTGFSHYKGCPKPDEIQENGKPWLKWGKKNDYPFYLIDMLNGSAWHQGLIKQKVHYIVGKGLEETPQNQVFLNNKWGGITMNQILAFMSFDYELFDAFALLGTWNREGTRVAKWEYLPIEKIRTDQALVNFYLSDDWSQRMQSPEKTNLRVIPSYNPDFKEGQFIVYFKNPHKYGIKDYGVYPKPSYNGGLTAINTDVLISKYHLSEIQNGFKGGTIVNLANGEPESEEAKRAIKNQIKGSTTNVEDANEVIITFSNGNDNAPSVLSLNGNDLADRYNLTEKTVQQNILVAHQVTTPLLFGIKTEGQLGGATELMEGYGIFKNTYVEPRRKVLVDMITFMSELSGVESDYKIIDNSPFETKSAVTPVQEESDTFSKDEGIDEMIKIFSQFGKPKSELKSFKSVSVRNDFEALQVEELEQETLKGFFATIGEIANELSEPQKQVLALLTDKESGVSISQATDLSISEISKILSQLTDLGLIEDGVTTDLGNSVLDTNEVQQDIFKVVYTYEVKAGLGAEIIPTSRDFCKELIRLDRFYTREEINQISSIVGRDVWRYRGGFYRNPNTDRTTPWCRHEWRQQITV